MPVSLRAAATAVDADVRTLRVPVACLSAEMTVRVAWPK
jgi:hypothetical protein